MSIFFKTQKINCKISDSLGHALNGFSIRMATISVGFLQNGNVKLLIKSITPGLKSGGVGQSNKAITAEINWAPGNVLSTSNNESKSLYIKNAQLAHSKFSNIENVFSYEEYKSLIVEYGKNTKFPDLKQ